ncbi:Uncharacterized protein TCM_000088 [Theobroma cacao]|uniref:Uncharacterized protein n=1 Tax=Theobroma cacao TaxID=3641 RepID=A0A061DGC8_THECC|nr:Uncharacterized protein TCM_000088 [Theobroma cacao]
MKSVTMTKQNMGLLTLIFSKLSSGAGGSGPRQEQTPNKEDKTLEKVADTFFVLSSVGLDRVVAGVGNLELLLVDCRD